MITSPNELLVTLSDALRIAPHNFRTNYYLNGFKSRFEVRSHDSAAACLLTLHGAGGKVSIESTRNPSEYSVSYWYRTNTLTL